MKYTIYYTAQFKKDLKIAKKQHKDIDKLFLIIEMLANSIPLEKKYFNHKLSGKFKDCWECHIEPDWLLIYKISEKQLILLLYRTGTHSELLKK